MLGVAGMLLPEILTKAGLINAPLCLPAGEVGYPGGIFNPLNFPTNLEYKEKEIANGRLAMLAFLGFLVQSNLTGKGPVENLLQHLSDPWHTTIIQTLGLSG
ncbi:unnamed protein product [Sphagnum troendelagicum]|uniref:Chlorophyll a-b binding protein, chloroplastic n=1 Tax=Sphagnum troendelagicum TaxID=128251 RepID=A0ABP0U1A2_9BRYO